MTKIVVFDILKVRKELLRGLSCTRKALLHIWNYKSLKFIILIITKIIIGGMLMNFQNMILTLQNYWAKQGCIMMQPYDVEKGAGTMNPNTLLRSLGPEPWRAIKKTCRW